MKKTAILFLILIFTALALCACGADSILHEGDGAPERSLNANIGDYYLDRSLDEMYKLTKDIFYVEVLIKVIRYYYSDKDGTGDRFYPDGCMFANSLETIIKAGLQEKAKDVFERFDTHIENIVEIGITYPSHEVFYEQAIVAPAVTLLLDKYRLCGDKKYLEEAKKHLKVLRRFDGFQPDHRLHNIAVRYWDDFWFGKSYMYVDSMPHYWTAYSGIAFALFFRRWAHRN